MADVSRELRLEELPPPPLFQLAGDDGRDVFAETTVGDELSRVGALFETRELAEEFSGRAEEFGMSDLSGLGARELAGWGAVGAYAASGMDYVLVVSGAGTGLFHAGDVSRVAAERAAETPLPLYLFSDERGAAPLISVQPETDPTAPAEETLVAALFSSPEKARAFREKAPHLDLPDLLATIEDRDGLRRHALVAREAGAVYAVIDPGPGHAEAIPIEDLI